MVHLGRCGGGGRGGVKLVMRSLENRLRNGKLEEGSLPSTTLPTRLKRNKRAISIPYLMARPLKNYSQIQTETMPPGGQLQLPVGAA